MPDHLTHPVLSIFIFSYFLFPLQYILELNIVLLTPLHLFDEFSNYEDDLLHQSQTNPLFH